MKNQKLPSYAADREIKKTNFVFYGWKLLRTAVLLLLFVIISEGIILKTRPEFLLSSGTTEPEVAHSLLPEEFFIKDKSGSTRYQKEIFSVLQPIVRAINAAETFFYPDNTPTGQINQKLYPRVQQIARYLRAQTIIAANRVILVKYFPGFFIVATIAGVIAALVLHAADLSQHSGLSKTVDFIGETLGSFVFFTGVYLYLFMALPVVTTKFFIAGSAAVAGAGWIFVIVWKVLDYMSRPRNQE